MRPILVGVAALVFLSCLSDVLNAQDTVATGSAVITHDNADQIEQLGMWGRGRIGELAFSPDGQTVVVGSSVGLWFYDATDLSAEPHLFNAGLDFVNVGKSYVPTFSSDWQTLATVQDEEVRLWDVATGELVATLPTLFQNPGSLTFTPDGETLVIEDYIYNERRSVMHLWDIAAGEIRATLEGHTHWVSNLTVSTDGTTLVSTSWDGTARLWDVQRGTLIAVLAPGGTDGDYIHDAVFTPDSATVITGGNDGHLRLWDAKTGEALAVFGRVPSIFRIAISPDGQTLATGHFIDIEIHLWDITSGSVIATLRGQQESIEDLVFSPDGTQLASTSSDQTVRLWNVATRKEVATASGYNQDAPTFTFSPDGYTVAHTLGGFLHLLDTRTGAVTLVFDRAAPYMQIAFSPDGTTLAYRAESSIVLWNVLAAQEAAVIDTMTSSGVNQFAFSPDGYTLANSNFDGVELIDLHTGMREMLMDAQFLAVGTPVFSPDGQWLAVGGEHSYYPAIVVWEVATGERLALLRSYGDEEDVSYILFSVDGQRLFSANGERISVWDVQSSTEIARFEGHTSVITHIDHNPYGQLLVSSSFDGTVRLWDAETGELLAVPIRETPVLDLVVSPDGRTLVTTQQGAVKFWGIPPA